MRKRNIFLTAIILLVGSNIEAQKGDVYGILTGLKGEINLRFKVSDSLCPVSVKSVDDFQKELQLSKQEIREVRKGSNGMRGIRLDNALLKGANFISAISICNAYQIADSSSLSFIEKNKPFYTLSLPIFFNNGQKAIIDLDLVGSGGYTYLMVKKDDKWVIEKKMLRWVV